MLKENINKGAMQKMILSTYYFSSISSKDMKYAWV